MDGGSHQWRVSRNLTFGWPLGDVRGAIGHCRADDVASNRAECTDGDGWLEAAFDEGEDAKLGDRLAMDVRSERPFHKERKRLRMQRRDFSKRHGDDPDACPPITLELLWQTNRADQFTDDRVEHQLLRIEVVVERHGLDAEVVAKAAHAERVQPIGVDPCERGGDDPFAG